MFYIVLQCSTRSQTGWLRYFWTYVPHYIWIWWLRVPLPYTALRKSINQLLGPNIWIWNTLVLYSLRQDSSCRNKYWSLINPIRGRTYSHLRNIIQGQHCFIEAKHIGIKLKLEGTTNKNMFLSPQARVKTWLFNI